MGRLEGERELKHFVPCNENKPAAQAAGQTLPDGTTPVGKIPPFCKIAVTFEQIQRFRSPSRFRHSLFYDWKHHFKPFVGDGAVKILNETVNQLINE